MANVTADIWLTSVRVYINETLHLKFRRNAFVSLHSWPDENAFRIEVTFREGQSMLVEYEKRETWAAVLAALDELDITAV